MDKKQYKILKINRNSLATYGDVFIVYANRPNSELERIGLVSFSYSVGDETELFVFPPDMATIKPIDAIGRSGQPWEPDPNDFQDEGQIIGDGRRMIAHFHNSLVPSDKTLMTFIPDEVTFDNVRWNKIEENDEWRFSLEDIKTPYGSFSIDGFMEVEQNGQVGIQMEVYGFLELDQLPGYTGEYCGDDIQTIAIVRQPQNIWLWVHMFNTEHQHVASFSGTEKDVMANELAQYVLQLRKRSNG